MKVLKGDREYWETYDGHIAFYKYGVKAFDSCLLCLKNWVVLFILFLQLGGRTTKFIEASRKCSISIARFKLYQ